MAPKNGAEIWHQKVAPKLSAKHVKKIRKPAAKKAPKSGAKKWRRNMAPKSDAKIYTKICPKKIVKKSLKKS